MRRLTGMIICLSCLTGIARLMGNPASDMPFPRSSLLAKISCLSRYFDPDALRRSMRDCHSPEYYYYWVLYPKYRYSGVFEICRKHVTELTDILENHAEVKHEWFDFIYRNLEFIESQSLKNHEQVANREQIMEFKTLLTHVQLHASLTLQSDLQAVAIGLEDCIDRNLDDALKQLDNSLRESLTGEGSKQFLIRSPYPNPFNSIITVEYYLPQASDMSISIYNILGEQVFERESPQVSAGNHAFRWNGRGATGKSVANGLYFMVFKTDAQSLAKKIVLLK